MPTVTSAFEFIIYEVYVLAWEDGAWHIQFANLPVDVQMVAPLYSNIS